MVKIKWTEKLFFCFIQECISKCQARHYVFIPNDTFPIVVIPIMLLCKPGHRHLHLSNHNSCLNQGIDIFTYPNHNGFPDQTLHIQTLSP